MKLFVDQGTGVIPSNVFPHKFLGKLSDAALFGTVESDPKNPQKAVRKLGLAFKYCSGILACEEFSMLKSAMQANYNTSMEDRLLVFQDSGVVETDLRGGGFGYTSGAVMWNGNQSDRIWFGSGESGLARRNAVDYVIIDEALNALLKEAERKRARIAGIAKIQSHLGQRLRYIVDNFHVKDIEHTQSYYDLLNEFGMGRASQFFGTLHHEEKVIEKICIGYNIMRYWEPAMTVMPINVDDELRTIVRRQVALREFLFANRDLVEAELVLRLGKHEGRCEKESLVREMKRFGGHSPVKVDRTIDSCQKAGRVVVSGHGYSQVVELPHGHSDAANQ
jgi:hypothetical protein